MADLCVLYLWHAYCLYICLTGWLCIVVRPGVLNNHKEWPKKPPKNTTSWLESAESLTAIPHVALQSLKKALSICAIRFSHVTSAGLNVDVVPPLPPSLWHIPPDTPNPPPNQSPKWRICHPIETFALSIHPKKKKRLLKSSSSAKESQMKSPDLWSHKTLCFIGRSWQTAARKQWSIVANHTANESQRFKQLRTV